MSKVTFLLLLSSFSIQYGYSQVPPPLYPGEVWTGMYSVGYELQATGSVRQIVRDPSNPANLYAVMTACEDSVNITSDSRFVFGAYSTDYGLTWTKGKVSLPSGVQAYMDVRMGAPIFGYHLQDGVHLFQMNAFNSFISNEITGIPIGTLKYYFVKFAPVNNNNIFLTAMDYNLNQNKINFTYYDTNNWTGFLPLAISGTVYDVVSDGDSLVYVTGVENIIQIPNHTFPLIYYTSTNGGSSFFDVDTIAQFIPDGNDILAVPSSFDGGTQALIVDEELHVVFTAGVNGNGNAVPNVGLYHWSQSTGRSKIAGLNNIPDLEDTIITAINATAWPITRSTIGRTPNGTLLCAYNVYLDKDTQTIANGEVYNTGEIFYSYSNDNGLTWSNPRNITNTPGIDEKYPSLIRNNSADSLHVYYIRDMLAGNWNQNSLSLPAYAIYNRSSAPIGIQNISNEIPAKFYLHQNYPNPFNPETRIKFTLPGSSDIQLKVYDISGKEIRKLVNKQFQAGTYEYIFDGSNLPSGVYFYELKAGDFREVKKMVLVK